VKKILFSLILSFLLSIPVFGQTVPAFSEQCTLPTNNGALTCILRQEEGQGIGSHVLSWTINGTNSGSTGLLEYSDTSQTSGFSTLITGTTTSSGESAPTSGTHKYWRLTISNFTATSVPASVTIVHKGYNFTPGTASIGSITIDQSTPGTTNGIVCNSGCSGGTQYTQDVALTIGTSVGPMAMGRASAAAPADVSADNDAVLPWYMRSGAQAVQLVNAGVLTLSGSGTATGAMRVELPTNGTGVIATVGTITNAVTVTDGAGALNTIIDSGTITAVTSITNALPAGSNIIGNFRIDQTTPGTTNGVVLAAETTKVIGTARVKYSDGTDMLPSDVVLVNVNAATTGGATPFKYTSVASAESEHEIKATAGTLYSLVLTNTAATVAYYRCSNLTAANTTPGTSTEILDVAVPGATTGDGIIVPIPATGIAFSTALTCWIVTGEAENDTTEVGADDVKVFAAFK